MRRGKDVPAPSENRARHASIESIKKGKFAIEKSDVHDIASKIQFLHNVDMRGIGPEFIERLIKSVRVRGGGTQLAGSICLRGDRLPGCINLRGGQHRTDGRHNERRSA
jgi:hypothetical protein